MATLLEHVYAIQHLLNKGVPSDDTRVRSRLVEHYLKTTRSRLIKQKLDRQRYISKTNYQSICVPLEVDDYHDCTCIADEFDCKVLKSTCKIPKEIVGAMGSSMSIRFVDGTVLPTGTPTRHKYASLSLSQADATEPFWFMENQKLIIFNKLDLPVVMVRAIWEDPVKLEGFCNCSADGTLTNDPCYDQREDEFPIDSDLVDPMYRLTMEFLTQMFRFPEDNENNAKSVENINEQE